MLWYQKWLSMRKNADLEFKIHENFARHALQSAKCQLQAKIVTWEWKLHVYPWSLINVANKFRIDFFTENISEIFGQRSVPDYCFWTAGNPLDILGRLRCKGRFVTHPFPVGKKFLPTIFARVLTFNELLLVDQWPDCYDTFRIS